MTIMDEDINWMKLTHMLSIFSLQLSPPPLLYLPFASKTIIAFLYVHTEENDTSPLYILCMLMPRIISLSTLMLICTWLEDSTPPPKSGLVSIYY